MKSIKELYRIGTGPSSSHTMGPRKAAEMFVERHPDAASFKVTLYGSLAATGKGHMTDVAIIDTLQPAAPVEIVWQGGIKSTCGRRIEIRRAGDSLDSRSGGVVIAL